MKTKSMHTPGPWTVEQAKVGGYTIKCKGEMVEAIDPFSGKSGKMLSGQNIGVAYKRDCYDNATVANANLFAAAPDLLAAVKAARANGTLGQTLTPAQLTAMLDAAIAKAEGR